MQDILDGCRCLRYRRIIILSQERRQRHRNLRLRYLLCIVRFVFCTPPSVLFNSTGSALLNTSLHRKPSVVIKETCLVFNSLAPADPQTNPARTRASPKQHLSNNTCQKGDACFLLPDYRDHLQLNWDSWRENVRNASGVRPNSDLNR